MDSVAANWARSSEDVGASASSIRASLRGAYLSIAGTLAIEPKGDFLHCLYLHSVYDDQVENFTSLLDALLDIGRFIETREVFDIIEDRAKLNGRLFHLSFDDGFDNNHRNAFPSLSERGIQAAFFVPSTLVGASDAFVLDHWWAPEQSPTRFMTWSQVRELSEAGHEIGSHTRTHKRLRSDERRTDELRDQIRGSKQEIEDRLGSACRYIAWPFGTAQDTTGDRRPARLRVSIHCLAFRDRSTTSRMARSSRRAMTAPSARFAERRHRKRPATRSPGTISRPIGAGRTCAISRSETARRANDLMI